MTGEVRVRSDLGNEIGVASAKVAPALGVAAASVTGWGVQEWMYAGTLGYIILQALYLLWKWRREWKAKQV